MLPRMNKMLPTFREISSDYRLMIVAFVLSLQPRNNLQKKPEVRTNMSNKSKYAREKR